jgi:DNA modification methylase
VRSKRGSTIPWRNRIVGHADMPPAELVANPANWRLHPTEQARALGGALGEVGWVAQCLVNRRTGHLVDGHLRVELALARGEPAVPVTYVDLTDDEERLVLASLDPLGAMARADTAKLEELLAELSPADDALAAMLTELAQRNGIAAAGLTDPDEVGPLPAETDVYVEPGELYRLGEHRLLCGDATDPADVARLLEGAQPTLLVTDPPYGVELDPTWRDGTYNRLGPAEKPYMMSATGGRSPIVEGNGAPTRSHRRTAGHRNTTLSGDTRADWSEAFALVPSLSVGYVWHAGVHAAQVAAGLEAIGFEIVSQIIWDKGIFAMGRSWYHWGHEPCWAVRRPGVPNLFTGTDRTQSTVWRAPSPKMLMGGSKETKYDHPAQKPVLLYEIPIANHTGDLYDPFLGSGTTLIAAERLRRRAYTMEIDPRYVQLAIERWTAFSGETAVRVDD